MIGKTVLIATITIVVLGLSMTQEADAVVDVIYIGAWAPEAGTLLSSGEVWSGYNLYSSNYWINTLGNALPTSPAATSTTSTVYIADATTIANSASEMDAAYSLSITTQEATHVATVSSFYSVAAMSALAGALLASGGLTTGEVSDMYGDNYWDQIFIHVACSNDLDELTTAWNGQYDVCDAVWKVIETINQTNSGIKLIMVGASSDKIDILVTSADMNSKVSSTNVVNDNIIESSTITLNNNLEWCDLTTTIFCYDAQTKILYGMAHSLGFDYVLSTWYYETIMEDETFERDLSDTDYETLREKYRSPVDEHFCDMEFEVENTSHLNQFDNPILDIELSWIAPEKMSHAEVYSYTVTLLNEDTQQSWVEDTTNTYISFWPNLEEGFNYSIQVEPNVLVNENVMSTICTDYMTLLVYET